MCRLIIIITIIITIIIIIVVVVVVIVIVIVIVIIIVIIIIVIILGVTVQSCSASERCPREPVLGTDERCASKRTSSSSSAIVGCGTGILYLLDAVWVCAVPLLDLFFGCVFGYNWVFVFRLTIASLPYWLKECANTFTGTDSTTRSWELQLKFPLLLHLRFEAMGGPRKKKQQKHENYILVNGGKGSCEDNRYMMYIIVQSTYY